MSLSKFAWMQNHGLSNLTTAILLGMIAGNSHAIFQHRGLDHGMMISKQTLLRAGIILYGLRLSFRDIQQLGGTTFAIALFLGKKVFALDDKLTVLIGAGSSVCGAAAIMATSPVIKGKSDDASIAISGVMIFGTLSMLMYPLVFEWNRHVQVIPLSTSGFGIYVGSTMHEVAQVIVAGKAVSDSAGDAAVITKMLRVMMLAPFLLLLPFVLRLLKKHNAKAIPQTDTSESRIEIPWFAFMFIGVAAINSVLIIPTEIRTVLTNTDNFILCMSMVALGLSTKISTLRQAGIKPVLLAMSLWLWLIFGGAAINYVCK
jgi:uncharacterized integral membrane protein (TIGR00698 family)